MAPLVEPEPPLRRRAGSALGRRPAPPVASSRPSIRLRIEEPGQTVPQARPLAPAKRPPAQQPPRIVAPPPPRPATPAGAASASGRSSAIPRLAPAPTGPRHRRSAVRARCRRSRCVRASRVCRRVRAPTRNARACRRRGRRWARVLAAFRPAGRPAGGAARQLAARADPGAAGGAAADQPHHHAGRGHDRQGPVRQARGARQGRAEGAARPPDDDEHQLGGRHGHRPRGRPARSAPRSRRAASKRSCSRWPPRASTRRTRSRARRWSR